MRIALWLGAALVAVALLAAIAQHRRYLETRREILGDRQPIAHSSRTFHVVTLLDLTEGQELLAAVGGFVTATEAAGGSAVYAGKVVAKALVSEQIPQDEWDAFLLAQFPSRQAYERAAGDAAYRAARARFASSYAMGMQRPPWINAGVPLLLLARRAADLLTRVPARQPFTPATQEPATLPRARRDRVVAGLLANRDWGERGVAVLNFVRSGDAAQQRADAAYVSAMLGMMAESGAGPMHMGRAVTLEGEAEFDRVAIVYYPGVQFFADLIRSEFFTSIVGDKQLADSLSAPSVPLLPHL